MMRHNEAELRAIADSAQQLTEGLRARTDIEDAAELISAAEAVEDLLRYLVGDAPATNLLVAATMGKVS